MKFPHNLVLHTLVLLAALYTPLSSAMPGPNDLGWSEWLDRDRASGSGDFELRANFGHICANPTGIEGRVNGTVFQSREDAPDILSSFSAERGLVCRNAEQSDRYCNNYQVRFFCPTPADLFTDHALNRIGYGPTELSRQRFEELGLERYVDEQLYFYQGMPRCAPGCPIWNIRRDKLLRATGARTQLKEKLADFWFNHFNVNIQGRPLAYALGPYEQTIRQSMNGYFENLLIAVAKHPAMLIYLDNASSSAGAINENYARELLELHTVGIDGIVGSGINDAGETVTGYTDQDIISIANVLTGWRTRRGNLDAGEPFSFYRYDASRHDTNDQVIFPYASGIGQQPIRISGSSGERGGDTLLRTLARHPATARFISTKLVRRFINEENPPASTIDAAVATWLAQNGNLFSVVQTILTHDEFRNPANFNTKVKPPLHFTASMMRAFNYTDYAVDVNTNPNPFINSPALPWRFASSLGVVTSGLINQGQLLYQVPPPTGTPEETDFWISSASMLARFDTVMRLVEHNHVHNGIPVQEGPADELVDSIISQLSLPPISSNTRLRIIEHVSMNMVGSNLGNRRIAILALLFASPEFMRY